MTVSGISNASHANAISQYGNAVQKDDTNRQPSIEGGRPPGPPPGGGLIGAVMQTLSQIGAGQAAATESDGSSAAAGTGSSARSALQSFGEFMQSLMAALHAQGPDGEAASVSRPGGNGSLSAGGFGEARAPGGPGRLENDLQALIDGLSSSDASASDPDAGALTELDRSFSSLLSALGMTDGTTTLQDFLETLASKLQSGGPAGNVIDTLA
ncbi:MAG TPA: hypothetical protein VEC06_15790 [Paucimonas sp.]|nr:hypothetical protein [Paucimonas sp.]